jgi:hypothetical protein
MAPGAVRAALGLHGVPVTEPQDVTGWTRSDATISATITFGPYAERVDATDVLVWVAGEGPDQWRLTGDLGLPPGVPFEFDLGMTVGG